MWWGESRHVGRLWVGLLVVAEAIFFEADNFFTRPFIQLHNGFTTAVELEVMLSGIEYETEENDSQMVNN